MRIVRYTYPTYRSMVRVPATFERSPWSSLDSEINRLFASAQNPAVGSTFPVDLYQDEANAYVRAELPGLNREDIQVEMTDENLTINGVQKIAATEGQPEQTSLFNRSLYIPVEISAEKVTAVYENGVLTVTLPKREEAKPKKVTVAVK